MWLSSWKRSSCVFLSSWCGLLPNESDISCIYTVIQLHKHDSVLVKHPSTVKSYTTLCWFRTYNAKKIDACLLLQHDTIWKCEKCNYFYKGTETTSSSYYNNKFRFSDRKMFIHIGCILEWFIKHRRVHMTHISLRWNKNGASAQWDASV